MSFIVKRTDICHTAVSDTLYGSVKPFKPCITVMIISGYQCIESAVFASMKVDGELQLGLPLSVRIFSYSNGAPSKQVVSSTATE